MQWLTALAGQITQQVCWSFARNRSGGNGAWLRRVAERFAEQISGRTRPRYREVVRFIADDPGFRRAMARLSGRIRIERPVFEQFPGRFD